MTQHSSPLELLRQRRFAPFFLTQLAGAFTDSFLKQLVLLAVTFNAGAFTSLSPGLIANAAAGLFIAPFILFSSLAGQLADKIDKSKVIRWIKGIEFLIVAISAVGFAHKNLSMLLLAVFGMGCHSAFFGPAKYAMLPSVLSPQELTGGNGLLELGTFLSILLGTLAAGLLLSFEPPAAVLIAALFACSSVGWLASLAIPRVPCADPQLRLSFNFFKDTWVTVKEGKAEGDGVWNSLLAVSWFWFVGALVLSQIPSLAQDTLHGDPSVASLLLGMFSIGVALGALLCEKLSGHKVEIGLVPLGSLGLSVFIADLALACASFGANVSSEVVDWKAFAQTPGALRVLLDVLLLGGAGGIFVVPLYAFIQLRTRRERQARVISANNILNSVFMLMSAALAAGLLHAGVSVTALLGVCAALNAAVAVYVYKTVPEFLWRFIAWALSHTVYRLRISAQDLIPDSGAVLLAPNHVTYADALLVCALSPRPIRFVMDADIFKMPVLRWLFTQVKAIPITAAKKDPAILESAMLSMKQALENGEVVCLFPEGALSRNGQLGEFKPGVTWLAQATSTTVLPVALVGLHGSLLSPVPGSVFSRVTRWRPRRQVEIKVGPAMPEGFSPQELRMAVSELMQHA